MKENMSPQQLVAELDRYIIGQEKAKKAVAIAIRNRHRRSLLADDIRDEVTPKNILMVGSTGVGKTEIARRLARILKAPFVKVEATKFTEVGYVGRDVESMVRDLMNNALSLVREELQQEVEEQAQQATEEALLDVLLPSDASDSAENQGQLDLRERFRGMLRQGELEARVVEIKVRRNNRPTIEFIANGNPEEMGMDLGNVFSNLFHKGAKTRRLPLAQAREIIMQEQRDRLVDEDKAVEMARDRAQNQGIIFIDEIDKIVARGGGFSGQDVSREGVQRDVLPIVEGSTVNSKYGPLETRHILFIAAGAFSFSKPSDLIPELQGRFPLRVDLEPLTAADFERILVAPQNSLTRQYTALLQTENVRLEFSPEAISYLAQLASQMNQQSENIGARRLHTVMESLLEEVSFRASEMSGETVQIDRAYVESHLSELFKHQDLQRFIL